MDSPALTFAGANIASGYMRVYNNANQAPTGTGTRYPSFNTVDADTLGIWDAANTRAVIKSSGFYSLFWRCTPNNNSSASTTPGIDINGIVTWCEDGTVPHISAGFVRYLTAGDVVKACYYKGTTGTWTTLSSGNDLCEFIICGPFASSSIGTNLDVSVFPSNPVHYQRVRYIGDANLGPTRAYWDANVGHWLSEEILPLALTSYTVGDPPVSTNYYYAPIRHDYPMCFLGGHLSAVVNTTNSGSNIWTFQYYTILSNQAASQAMGASFTSLGWGIGTFVATDTVFSPRIITSATDIFAALFCSRGGSAGQLFPAASLDYRLVLG